MTKCIKCKKEIPQNSTFCLFCGKKQITQEKKKTKKRANGTGSVYKLSGNRKKPFYAVKCEMKGDILIKIPLGCFATETEARLALDAANNKEITAEFNSSLKDVYAAWSRIHFKGVSPQSIEGYESAYKHLSPLYNKKMREIKTDDFQKVIDSMIKKGRSRSSCNKIKILSNQLSKYAMERDIISKNYAQFIKLPKEVKKEKDIFTKKDINILFKNRWKLTAQIILVMIYTGVRIGELFSIETKNVFLKEKYMIGGEKTEAGINRIIPLHEKIIPFIEAWYDPQNEYLLTNTKGGQKNARNFREREFYPFLEETGIISKDNPSKKLTPHSTRHTFASMMVQADAKPELLQKIIGHEKYETTIDFYTHFTKEDISEMLTQINAI